MHTLTIPLNNFARCYVYFFIFTKKKFKQFLGRNLLYTFNMRISHDSSNLFNENSVHVKSISFIHVYQTFGFSLIPLRSKCVCLFQRGITLLLGLSSVKIEEENVVCIRNTTHL